MTVADLIALLKEQPADMRIGRNRHETFDEGFQLETRAVGGVTQAGHQWFKLLDATPANERVLVLS